MLFFGIEGRRMHDEVTLLKKKTRLLAQALRVAGESFHRDLIHYAEEEVPDSWGPATNWTLGQIVAETASWAVENESQRDSLREAILAALEAEDPALVRDVYRYKAGRLAVEAWLDLVRQYPSTRPPVEVVHEHYEAQIEGGRLQKWSALIPLKLLSILDDWPRKRCADFYVPLGVNVRTGLKNVVGIEVRPTEPATDQQTAWTIHNHFARLAKTDVFTINSGFWEAGAQW